LLALWLVHLKPPELVLLTEGIFRKNLSKFPSHIAGMRKSSSVVMSTGKPWKLTRNFSFNYAHDVIDLGGSLTYQLVAAFLSDMMKDLA
jgi:hypothetical protein